MSFKNIIIVILKIFFFILIIMGIGYVFFVIKKEGLIKSGNEVIVRRENSLTFQNGNNLSFTKNDFNTYKKENFVSKETTSSATLIANSVTSSAADTYQVNLNITDNNFKDEDSSNKTRIILEIFAPDGNKISFLPGLDYVNIEKELEGFDITDKTGLYSVAINYGIATNNMVAGAIQSWKMKISFINFDLESFSNEEILFNANILLQKLN